jgi:enoyl-CoA hydratase/carnithine racemase
MSTESSVRVERTRPLATVTMCRPEALNAITQEMLLALDSALEDISAADDVRGVVLTGEGRAFSAGVDLNLETPMSDG